MKQICKNDIVNDNFSAESDNFCNTAISSMKKISSAILIDGSGWGDIVEHQIFEL